MLHIMVPGSELYDDKTEEFVYLKPQSLQLEHSLVSLSKWESRWHKAFLSKKEKTHEEILDYIKCMTLTQNVDPDVYYRLTEDNIDAINAYIDEPMTATHFPDEYEDEVSQTQAKDVVTSELIYYWMFAQNIPFECRKWHLNKLLTLIRVCSIKNAPPDKKKKRNARDIMSRNARINEMNKKRFNSKG